MSLQTLTSSTSDRAIRMRSRPQIASDIVITKPPTVANKCPFGNESKRFPVIEDAPQKKKSKKKSASPSDSLEFWLKPGISLPKLHSKNISRDSTKTGEVYTCFSYSNLTRKQTESELGEILSADSVKPLRTDSESYEVPSDVIGPSQCQFVFNVPSSELNLDKLQTKEEVIEEDHALQNWRRWTQRHKRQQNSLCQRLKKKPFDLVIQKTDLYRQRLENKILLSTCDIPQADKWRGHPYDLTPPIEAKKTKEKGFRPLEGDLSPTYFLQKTQAQEGIVNDLEFIGIPEVIKREKGLQSGTRFHFALIKSNQKIGDAAAVAAEERIQSFLKLRSRMRPPSVNFKEMAVVGSKVPSSPKVVVPEPPVTADLPGIEVTGPEDETYCQDTPQSIFCLVINDVEIKYDLDQGPRNENEGPWHCTWKLDFGVNELSKRVEKILKIENRGTVAVRYRWISKKSESNQNLTALAPKHHEPWFFFNKNSGIFLPGQFYNLKFYCHARKPGVRTETWYMRTSPPLDKNTGCGTIMLSAVASGDCSDSKCHVLEAYLRKRVKESIVKFILDILLKKATSSDENLRGLEYQSLFFEKELFEYHNPNYYYHLDMVQELTKLFEKIPFKVQNKWDLSLDSLKTLITKSTKGKDRDILLCSLCTAAKRLLKPSHVFTRKEKRYRMVHNILCKMTNFMESDYNHIRNILSNKKRGAEERSTWLYPEYAETLNSVSSSSEEKCELDSGPRTSLCEITPVNLIYFQTLFYIKVYHRVSEAVENIAGLLETSKVFKSSGNPEYKLSKPPKQKREFEFFPCL